ncbi:MAG: hypothetical protein QXX55_00910 [Candidatus Pacearchaeota archaeon]
MTSRKQPTKEEIENKKAIAREIALKNLKSSELLGLATSYFVQLETSGYGKVDQYVVDEFIYKPSIRNAKAYDLRSGKESNILYDSLLGSRQDGRLWSGNLSEYNIIKNGAEIVKDSILAIKIDDLIQLMGSKIKIKEAYKGKYIREIIEAGESGNKEAKELTGILIENYINYVTMQNVSKALGISANKIKDNLESILKEEEKK